MTGAWCYNKNVGVYGGAGATGRRLCAARRSGGGRQTYNV